MSFVLRYFCIVVSQSKGIYHAWEPGLLAFSTDQGIVNSIWILAETTVGAFPFHRQRHVLLV